MAQAYDPDALIANAGQNPIEMQRLQRNRAMAAALASGLQVPSYEATGAPADNPLMSKVLRTGSALYGLGKAGIVDPRQRAVTVASAWLGG